MGDIFAGRDSHGDCLDPLHDYHDKLKKALGSEEHENHTWHLVSTYVPWMAARARRTLLDDVRSSSMVDSSTKRRWKMKGEGSFNAYGSEDPRRRIVGKRIAHHAHGSSSNPSERFPEGL
jgi:hypothetical protein